MIAAREKDGSGPPATTLLERDLAKHNKKRVRNFTADDRAAHRIFEKGRREAFKESLMVCEHAILPCSVWNVY